MHDQQCPQSERPFAKTAGVVVALCIAILVGIAGCKGKPAAPAAAQVARTRTAPQPPNSTPAQQAPVHVEARRLPAPGLPPVAQIAVDAIPATLKRADAALLAGNYDGSDEAALALYRNVLASDPKNAKARAGMDTLHVALLGRAQVELISADVAAAQHDADLLQKLYPDDPAAKSLKPRLAQAWRINALLARASRLQAAGHAIPPATPNAVAIYQQVQVIDPGNAAAEAALSAIENSYIKPALAAAVANRFPESDRMIALAARVRPESQALLDASRRIVEIRQRRASILQAQADSALALGDADSAQALLPQLDRAAPLSAEVQDLRKRIDLTRIYGTWRPGQSFTEGLRSGGRGPEMIVVPIGEFHMGSAESEIDHNANESPQHTIAFHRGFAMSREEITVAQFRQFVNATHYRSDAEVSGSSLVFDEAKNKLYPRSGVNWRHDFSGQPAEPGQPVIHVSWNDASAYAKWLSHETGHIYRLPNEAEFEYTLRAGTNGPFPWPGDAPPAGIGNLAGADDVSPSGRHWGNAFAHYGDGYWGSAPVGRFPPNAYGLYDMVGNISEWVQDCWHESYRRAPQDGSAWMNPGCARHVVRGTSWASAPDQARSAFRQPVESAVGNARLGFRVMRKL